MFYPELRRYSVSSNYLVLIFYSSGSKIPRPIFQQVHSERVARLISFIFSPSVNRAPFMSTFSF